MPKVKIYEVKSSATDNFHTLKSKDGLYFFWNDAKFTKNEPGDFVFIICRGAEEALFTKLIEKDIATNYNSTANTSYFNHNNNSYTVRGEWERFVRLDILEKKKIPPDWNWRTQLRSSEIFDLWKDDIGGDLNKRIEKVDDLELIFSSGEAYDRLESCRRNLSADSPEELYIGNTEELEEVTLAPATEYLSFNDKLRVILMSLKTKPFVLLAGISGTGKSRLVRTLAYKTCTNTELRTSIKPGNFELIKVKPNWHDSMELLGYESRISGKPEYVETDFLRFLVKAWQYLDVPFFLCLDEMNLAPVEQYFAEYLSVLETRRFNANGMATDPFLSSDQITGYSSRDKDFFKKLGIDNKPELQKQLLSEGLTLPSNLVVMGTVNMDETAYSFSRKVLDRAMTIEMNEMDLSESLTTKSNDWTYPATFINKQFVLGTLLEGYDAYTNFGDGEKVIEFLKKINTILEGSPFKIAYRVRDEVLIFCYHNSTLSDLPDNWLTRVMDEAILIKVLSRIEGDEFKVKRAIEGLLEILTEADYPKCNKKLNEMNDRLLFGYTSFWA